MPHAHDAVTSAGWLQQWLLCGCWRSEGRKALKFFPDCWRLPSQDSAACIMTRSIHEGALRRLLDIVGAGLVQGLAKVQTQQVRSEARQDRHLRRQLLLSVRTDGEVEGLTSD